MTRLPSLVKKSKFSMHFGPAVSPSSGRTATLSFNQQFGDRYGFDLTRQLVDSTTELACDAATSAICEFRYTFTKWAGSVPLSAVKAQLSNPSSGTPGGGNVAVRMKATLGGSTMYVESTGSIAP